MSQWAEGKENMEPSDRIVCGILIYSYICWRISVQYALTDCSHRLGWQCVMSQLICFSIPNEQYLIKNLAMYVLTLQCYGAQIKDYKKKYEMSLTQMRNASKILGGHFKGIYQIECLVVNWKIMVNLIQLNRTLPLTMGNPCGPHKRTYTGELRAKV